MTELHSSKLSFYDTFAGYLKKNRVSRLSKIFINVNIFDHFAFII